LVFSENPGTGRFVARIKPAEELSVEELRRLLIEKRRAERQARLEHYRRSGRVIVVEPQPPANPLENMRSEPSDENATGEEIGTSPRRRQKRRPWLDRLLFIIEIAAVLGLVFVLFNGFSLLRTLNKEVASVLVLPTLTPTPLITAVILPSGHTPPNSPGGVQPNDAEIPENLRPLVQAFASLPVPTPGPEQAIRIQIPALGVDAPIVQGDGWDQLKKGVAQHIGTPNPGSNGNLILSAHNDVFGEIFRDLDKLKTGDQVILFTDQRTFTYIVRQSQIVEPTQTEVMSQTKEAVVTLISCYPYMVDNQRIVITANLQKQP
jgi:sortase A